MVYSTCSMSPYEDEAVIAELLRQFKGQLELVDAREFVPVFKARPGMSDWYVLDDHLAIKKEVNTRKETNKRAKVEQKARDAVAAATATVAVTAPDAEVVVVAVASNDSSSSVAADVTVEVTPVDDVVHMVENAIEEEKKVPSGEEERDIYVSPVVSDPLLGTVRIFSILMYFISALFFRYFLYQWLLIKYGTVTYIITLMPKNIFNLCFSSSSTGFFSFFLSCWEFFSIFSICSSLFSNQSSNFFIFL